MQQPSKKRKPVQPISQLVCDMLAPSLRARGFASAEVITNWHNLVGAQLARHTKALQLKWPPKTRLTTEGANVKSGATLIIAVSSAYALEVQHMAPLIMERINTALGWQCITKLSLRQQSVLNSILPVKRDAPLTDAEIKRLEAATQKIDDENLRKAFTKLGKGVFEWNRKK